MALIIEETRLLFHYLIIRGIVLNGTIINISIIITQQQGSRTVKEVFLRLVYKPFFFVVSTHWVRSTHPRKSNPTRKSLVALRSSKSKKYNHNFFKTSIMPSLAHTRPRKYGKGSRSSRITGRPGGNGLIRKYGLNMKRQEFRELARSMGWSKFN